MSDVTTLIKIARATAQSHHLAEALVCAAAEHESGWEVYAVRYEPAFEKRWDPIAGLTPTEHYGRAFSYGLMQIMGETARELGFKGAYLTELCDPIVGLEYGCRKLGQCIEKHPGDLRAALLAYNGGSNPAYPDLVLKLVPKYQAAPFVDVNKATAGGAQ